MLLPSTKNDWAQQCRANMIKSNKSITQEAPMTQGLPRPVKEFVLNLPSSTQLLFCLSGRECGKALTRALTLVMETCSAGQRADWAWQPISCRKPSSGGTRASGCDSVHLSDGRKAPGLMVQTVTPRRTLNTGRRRFGRRKHWRPARLSTRLGQTGMWGQGYTVGSGWD